MNKTIIKRRNTRCIQAISYLFLGASANAFAVNDCKQQAHTELEQAYCQIITLNPQHKLPNINEFRQNSAKIQRLLLKRDAEKYHIQLAPLKTKTKTDIILAGPIKEPANTATSPPASELPPRNLLDGCSLASKIINCSMYSYQLQGNLPNNALSPYAFSNQNQLHFQTPELNQTTDFQYLSKIYPNYIYKMLDIGLGDSTMSFTKFTKIYWQSKHDKQDFAERFHYMYNKLKIEKRKNAIKTRYRDNYPSELSQCMYLNEQLIACDNVKQNWIYKRL